MCWLQNMAQLIVGLIITQTLKMTQENSHTYFSKFRLHNALKLYLCMKKYFKYMYLAMLTVITIDDGLEEMCIFFTFCVFQY